MDFLRTLSNKIVIDDVVVKKMRYDINMLFMNHTSAEKSKVLSKQIHEQLDKVLLGMNDVDKENIKKLVITDSFLVIKDPISNNISYGNVFTKLTNYDGEFVKTKIRLVDWLDQNTDIEYNEVSLTKWLCL